MGKQFLNILNSTYTVILLQATPAKKKGGGRGGGRGMIYAPCNSFLRNHLLLINIENNCYLLQPGILSTRQTVSQRPQTLMESVEDTTALQRIT